MASSLSELKPKLRRLFLHELAQAETGRSSRRDAARRIGAALSLGGVQAAPKSDPYIHIVLLALHMSAKKEDDPAAWEALRRMILELPPG